MSCLPRKPRGGRRKKPRLVIIAWNARVIEGGPVQPWPTIEVALACSYRFLRVRCQVCRQTAWIELEHWRRSGNTPVWKLEPSLWCTPCRDRGARAPRGTIERLTKSKSYGADEP